MRQIPTAALPIAALVCGYPGDRRRLRRLLMLQAYIDDSLDAGAVLALAGPIADVERWEAFSVEWQERLDHAPWDTFKMAEVWNRGGDISFEHAKWHYFTLRKYAQGAVCIFVPLRPLEQAATKHGLVGTPAANPYMWAFKGIINGVAQNQRDWGADKPIDFIFDERDEESQVRDVWEFYLSTLSDEMKEIHGRKPIFEDDKKVLPLQAADMWAWWCRKGWLDNGGQVPPDFYPVPWGEAGEIPQIVLQWSDSEIDAELARVASSLRGAWAGD